ncbi:MAG: hypothetical protein CME24_13650 [Gemmatimonadetes bacterium]|nr:hypothetical protein [Gemmatimonadota bacterium]
MRPSPIYEASEVEELPISDGVVDGTPAQLDTFDIGTQPLPLWLFRTGRCTRSITSETPSKAWDLAERVAAHLRVARACVRLLAPPS